MQIPYTKFDSFHACLCKLILSFYSLLFCLQPIVWETSIYKWKKKMWKGDLTSTWEKSWLKGQPWKSKSASSKNNYPSIYLCSLEDLPQQKNPRALCQEETSIFQLFLCSHKKTVGYMSEGSCIQGFSWASGKPLGSQPKVPQQNPLAHEPSLHRNNLKDNS